MYTTCDTSDIKQIVALCDIRVQNIGGAMYARVMRACNIKVQTVANKLIAYRHREYSMDGRKNISPLAAQQIDSDGKFIVSVRARE